MVKEPHGWLATVTRWLCEIGPSRIKKFPGSELIAELIAETRRRVKFQALAIVRATFAPLAISSSLPQNLLQNASERSKREL